MIDINNLNKMDLVEVKEFIPSLPNFQATLLLLLTLILFVVGVLIQKRIFSVLNTKKDRAINRMIFFHQVS